MLVRSATRLRLPATLPPTLARRVACQRVAQPVVMPPATLRRRPPPQRQPPPTRHASVAYATHAAAASATAKHSVFQTLGGAITGALSDLLTPKGLLAAAAVAITFGAIRFSLRSHPVERAYAKEIMATLGRVATPPPFAPEDVLLTRPAAVASLAASLDPAAGGAPSGFFLIITGPPGVGKTTLVRLALRELAKSWEEEAGDGEKDEAGKKRSSPSMPLPGGAAYVAAATHPRSNFGRELAAAVGFSFEEGVRTLDLVSRLFTSSSAIQDSASTTESLARAASALEEAALEIKARGCGRPLVVVDGADRLAHRDPDALLDMMEYAKGWAETGLATVTFVVGDPAALKLMRASPAFSRAAQPIVVEGPSVREAVEFLSRHLAVRGGGALPADLAHLATVVHDNWLLLEKAAALLVAGSVAADVAARIVADAEPRFAAAGLLDSTPHQVAGLALAHALAGLPEGGGTKAVLPPADWHRLCPDRAAQDALLLPGGWPGSPFRYEPGVGLSFASAADTAFVKTGLLNRVAFGGGGGAGEGAGVEEVE